MTELCYLSATEALRRFRDKTLSPVELMAAVIERAEAVEPKVEAFTQTYFEEALEAARAAEAVYAKGSEARPLEGLPVAIKEDKGVAGKPTTAGSLVFKDSIAGGDALPVERIRQAGAIIHARTNVCEMGAAGITGGRLQGPTKNPWNAAYNSGGSSGGAAAALACGAATLANGSDYCGSIRIPAASCGVVGYKPPRGRNPVSAFFNLDWYDHDGPMARSVADCALLQNAMSGRHPSDLFSLKDEANLPLSFEGVEGMRVALSIDLGFAAVDPEVTRNTHAVAAALGEAGAAVEEVELGWTDEITAAFRDHAAVIFGAWVADYLDDHSHEMTGYAIAMGESAAEATAKDFLASMARECAMWDALSPILERNDLLLCPTLALPAVPLDFDPAGPDLEIAGRPVAADYGWMLTYPFNMLSPLPAIAVPSGEAASGVPTGVQIVGRPYQDLSVFRAAAALEAARPWSRRPDL